MFYPNTSQSRGLSYQIGLMLTILPILFITIGGITSANATDKEVSCYERGLIDGEDHPFNQSTYGKCGDDYYQGFIEGCMSVEGNDRSICESATDA